MLLALTERQRIKKVPLHSPAIDFEEDELQYRFWTVNYPILSYVASKEDEFRPSHLIMVNLADLDADPKEFEIGENDKFVVFLDHV